MAKTALKEEEKIEEEPRTLDEICIEADFSRTILGNTYCGLAMDKKIRCPYQAEKKDQNELYPCMNPKYNKNVN